MAQQTAIDWLWDISQEREIDAFDFLKAKAMEKEQIMRANIDGYEEAQRYGETSAEDYYNETYNK